MRATVQSPARGTRKNSWSESKRTHLTPFEPWFSITHRKMHALERAMKKIVDKPYIEVEPAAPGFIIPCTESEIRETITRIPSEFLKGLEAIIVIGGIKKMTKAYRKYYYGTYCNNWIFLAAFPQNWLTLKWRSISPKELMLYRQAGAKVEEIKGGIQAIFDSSSLKQFYLQYVLMHEIAHHVDQEKTTYRKQENFADWFATEYGYRLEHRNLEG
jgi:hypothetical protein